MDEDGKNVSDPLDFGVRYIRGFWEVFRVASTRISFPPNLEGRFTTEEEAVNAVVRYFLKRCKARTHRKDGRPKFTPRSNSGRRCGMKNKPGYGCRWWKRGEGPNGSSQTSNPV